MEKVINTIFVTLKRIINYFLYIKQFFAFKKINSRDFPVNWKDRRPCLDDKTTTTGFDRHYVYHTAWASRMLAKIMPIKHIDIGSKLYFSTITSAFIPIDFFDFRPAKIKLSNLRSLKGNLTCLPFKDNSVKSISCMHTIEHIGLGRYGDDIDPMGDLKAINELKRVISKNGNLLFVVPVGKRKVVFNAHRVYEFDNIIDYFSDFNLENFSLITDNGDFIENSTKKISDRQSYGCGCFWFKKI